MRGPGGPALGLRPGGSTVIVGEISRVVVGRAVDDGRAGHMKNTGAASGSWMAVGSGRYLGLSYVAERQECGGRADRRWACDPEGQRSSLGRSAVWSSDAPLMTDVRDT